MATPGRFCTLCGRPVEECGELSARGRCADCGEWAMLENVRQVKAHNGPYFTHWRHRVARSVGAILAGPADQRE